MGRLDFAVSKTGVPILSKDEIDAYAMSLLAEYDKGLVGSVQPVPIEDIVECHLSLDVDYKHLSLDESILGQMTFSDGYTKVFNLKTGEEEFIRTNKGTIIVEDNLLQDERQEGRLRFTYAHEASHWVLHRHRYETNENQGSLFDENVEAAAVRCLSRNIENDRVFSRLKGKTATDEDWLEWQADYMASAILMPKRPFLAASYSLLKAYNSRKNYIYLDEQPCNISMYMSVVDHLASLFNVSKRAAQIRLAKFGLVKQMSNQQSFAQICVKGF